MIIRDLQIEDIESLSKLYFQFWNEDSDIQKMKDKFNQLRHNASYIFLCAEADNVLLGSLTGIICEELYGDCRPFLVVENMVVDRTYREKGIGRELFVELEKRAKSNGCTQTILVTEAERKDACGFYESIGFHPTANKGYKKKIL
jgi:GNAT superfamily N-acetyltransferase